MLKRLRLTLEVLLRGLPTRALTFEAPCQPLTSPWDDDARARVRQSAALGLFDDEVCGFFMLMYRREPLGPRCDVQAAFVVEEHWWPSVAEAVDAVRPDRECLR